MATTPETDAVLAALINGLAAPKTVRDQDKMLESRSPGDVASGLHILRQECGPRQESFTMTPEETEL